MDNQKISNEKISQENSKRKLTTDTTKILKFK